jgi:hypothetical protein
LAAFFVIILYRVPRLDLAGAFLIGIALVGYDLWSELFRRRAR